MRHAFRFEHNDLAKELFVDRTEFAAFLEMAEANGLQHWSLTGVSTSIYLLLLIPLMCSLSIVPNIMVIFQRMSQNAER